MLNITKTRDGKKLLVALEGRLDTNTAPELEDSLSNELDDITELVIDLKNLEYIDLSNNNLTDISSFPKACQKIG